MPLPIPSSASDCIVNVQLANATAATVTYAPVPKPGRVKFFGIVPTVVTATGSATFQLAYAPPASSTFTNIASGLVTVPSATAAGVTTFVYCTPSSDNGLQDGGTLRITVGGTATGGGTPIASISIGN